MLDGGGHDRHQARDRAVHAVGVGHQLGVAPGLEAHAHAGAPHGTVEAFDALLVQRVPVVVEQHGSQALTHVDRSLEVRRADLLVGAHQASLHEPVAQGLGARELVLAALDVDAVHEALHQIERLGGGLGGCGFSRCHN